MTHDRTRISALVDGECSVDERDLVLAHVVGCDDCRAFYQQERAAKAALAPHPTAGTAAPTALVSSLLAMSSRSGATERPVARRRAAGPARPVELPGQRRRRVRRAAKGIGFSLLGAALLVAAAFGIGGEPSAGVAAPQLVAFGTAHEQASVVASDAGSSVPVSKVIPDSSTGASVAADLVLPAVSVAPATLAGLVLVSSSTDRAATRSTYSDGASTVSVFRQDGRVDVAKLGGFSTHRVDGAKLARKVGQPGYLVWTCHDVTYTVVGDSAGDLDRVATALPHVCPQNELSRVGRGMHRAAGWLNPLS
jgi:anti-sigma factor RsiW